MSERRPREVLLDVWNSHKLRGYRKHDEASKSEVEDAAPARTTRLR